MDIDAQADVEHAPGRDRDHPSAIPAAEIRAELGRVIASAGLQRSPQLQRLLRFLVEEVLAGRGDRLKEYVLGVEVFGRPPAYDPRLDSLVRVEARRLRGALEEYYRLEGSHNSIRIELRKGSYRPSFQHQEPEDVIAAPIPSPQAGAPRGRKWLAVAVAAMLAAGSVGYRPGFSSSVPVPRNPAIAVLPFDNLSSDPENQYFCFGLMDQITAELAKTGDLRVVARTSAASVKPGDDIRTIARQLNVDEVVEGSVRNFDSRVLVTAQLINAADTLHIWSETYERPNADLLKVQDEIAESVTYAVRQHLTSDSQKGPPRVRYSADAEANQLYWKAAYFRAPMGRTNWRKELARSAEYLERAVQRDDRFAVAYAALADVYVSLGWERSGGPTTSEFMSRGRRAASRALELDDSLAEAHGALGAVRFFYDYDRIGAENSFRRALALDPYNGKARMWYAYALVMQRRFDEAITQARQAKELDPLSYVATTHLAVVMYFSRHYDEAMRLAGETLRVANTAPAHGLRGMILAAQHNYDKAITEYEAGLRVVPNHSYLKGMLGHAYAMSGRTNEVTQLLKDANLGFEQGGLSDLKLAYIYVALGDRDRVFQHLESDYQQHDPELPYINVDPVFDPVRNDPRFTAMLQKLGLAQ